MLSIIAAGDRAVDQVRNVLDVSTSGIPLADAQLLSPVERPGKYLAIGMNYRKHVEEAQRLGVPPPKQQLWFNKQTSCLAGPYEPIDPGVTEQLDYEVELGVVIGRPAKRVSEADAPCKAGKGDATTAAPSRIRRAAGHEPGQGDRDAERG